MTTILIIIHIIVSLFLISIVLLQSGKGAELGAAFGGSSQTLFGSRGAATFLNKMTTVSAIVFMITSLTLAVVTAKGGSVVKKTPVTEGNKQIPATPGPIQGGGVQPVQPSQQTVPQIPPQQVPQAQKQTPVKTKQQVTQKQQQKPPQTQQPAPQTQQEVPQSQQTPTK